jgi:p-hydroxybenzoate 3-monooxygenase
MRTQVGIIGAGPAGLLLGRLLDMQGIDFVILEQRSRDYVLARVRAGVLEPGTVQTLRDCGVADRLDREGLPHEIMQFRWNKTRNDIPLVGEDGSKLVTYGQAEVVKDLIEYHEAAGNRIIFEAEVAGLDDLEGRPVIGFTDGGTARTLTCDFVAGCDGFHGVSRKAIPEAEAHSFIKEYPFSWLGILAQAKPNRELRGFAHSTRGLAVASARSESLGRLYLQVPHDLDPATMSDEEIWAELDYRMDDESGERLSRGPIIEKSVARLRGFVCTRMQHGRLCLAGDAAHIVPPSGAKGLNLAVGDVRVLSETIVRLLKRDDASLLDSYSEICLRRIWPTVHWSCLMSDNVHMFPGQSRFETMMQYEMLDHLVNSETGRLRMREAMLGRPYEI